MGDFARQHTSRRLETLGFTRGRTANSERAGKLWRALGLDQASRVLEILQMSTTKPPTASAASSDASSSERQTASIYDFPAYYDLIFGSDWKAEFDFLKEVFVKHVEGRCSRLFEPACGTGRLMFRFAKSGFHCDGLDLNEAAVEYCEKRMRRHGLRGTAWTADMTDFSVRKPYDAAFNTINSFRHLPSEKSARGHLDAMAAAIRPGGIYALGLHLTPLQGEPTETEQWSARRGNLQVNTSMWPKSKEPKKRVEQFHMRFDIHRPTGSMTIDDVLVLRSYTAKQMKSLIRSVPEWSIDDVYDFRYSIEDPIEIDEWTEDVVYILKRK
jgi:SAM-dependent methyltransferase